jgi:hypothetical protein
VMNHIVGTKSGSGVRGRFVNAFERWIDVWEFFEGWGVVQDVANFRVGLRVEVILVWTVLREEWRVKECGVSYWCHDCWLCLFLLSWRRLILIFEVGDVKGESLGFENGRFYVAELTYGLLRKTIPSFSTWRNCLLDWIKFLTEELVTWIQAADISPRQIIMCCVKKRPFSAYLHVTVKYTSALEIKYRNVE